MLLVLVCTALARVLGCSAYLSALMSVIVLATFFLFVELVLRKTYARPSSGLIYWNGVWRTRINWRRCFLKLLGLGVVLGLIASYYAIAPWYRDLEFQPYWDHLLLLGPLLAIVAVPYIVVVDAMMAEPEDSYSAMGRIVLLQWSGIDWRKQLNFLLGWAVKAFFLPIMVISTVSLFSLQMPSPRPDSVVRSAFVLMHYTYLLDVCFATVGYSMTLRILDSHIRSAHPFWWGWLVCLLCYPPVNQHLSWLLVGYSDGRQWYDWLANSPVLLTLWAGAIVFAAVVFAWATAVFGCRFSNLTNRGLITTGPYRYTKHPAYISKNLGFWLASMPFLSIEGSGAALMHCTALLSLNALYMLRALSEELHMSEDADYVAYAEWMNENGIFRWVSRVFPGFRYRSPGSPPQAADDVLGGRE